MIKQLRYLCTLLLMAVASVAWGEEESVTFSGQGYTNGQEISSYAGTNFSITFDKGTNSNAPKYYTSGTAIRCYGGNTFTISSATGTITKIVLTFGSSDGSNEITTDVGTYESGTWTGSANSVKFTIGGTTGNRRLSGVTVTYPPSVSDKVAMPVINGSTPFYPSTEVAISCGTDGASIQYSTDGTAWRNYSEPFTITETTTVQAKATKDGLTESEVASKTFTKGAVLDNIATLSTQTDAGTYFVTLANAVVTYVNGNYAYIEDASGAIVMYKSGHGLNAGDILTGTAEVVYQVRNGNPQITALSGAKATSGTAPEATTIAASSWSTPINTVLSKYFKVTGATITLEDSKYYTQLGEENVQLYGQGDAKNFALADLSVKYTLIGFPTVYNDTPELQIFVVPEAETAVRKVVNLVFLQRNVTATALGTLEAPELSVTDEDGVTVEGLDIKYSSNNTEVAEVVENTGEITIKGYGTAIITATFAGNDNYVEAEASYTITYSNPDQGSYTWDLSKAEYQSATEDLITWESDFAIMKNERNGNNTAVNNYIPTVRTSTRMYTGNLLTIQPQMDYKISSVEFTATTEGYASALNNSEWTNASASVNGMTVSLVPEDGSKAFSAVLSGTCGFTAVKINYVKNTDPIVHYSGNLFEFTYVIGNGPSEAQTITVEGKNLSEVLTVTASDGYNVSLDGENYSTSVSIQPTDGSVSQNVYVCLVAGLVGGEHNGQLTITSAGATPAVVDVYATVTVPIMDVITLSAGASISIKAYSEFSETGYNTVESYPVTMSDDMKYAWNVTDAMLSSSDLQLKKSTGNAISPVIKTPYGYKVTVLYTSDEPMTLTAGDVASTGATFEDEFSVSNGQVTLSVASTEAAFKLATGSKYATVQSVTITAYSAELAAYAVVEKNEEDKPVAVTFYYDDQKANREGTIVDITDGTTTGQVEVWNPQWNHSPFGEQNATLKAATFDKSFKDFDGLTSLGFWFACCSNLESITGLEYVNTSNVTTMCRLFYNCNKLDGIDVSNFNTSKVTNMGAMFYGCNSLSSIDVSNFNTANVTEMAGMFKNCSSLKTLDLSNFNTAQVKLMSTMFQWCSSLETLILGENFKTTAVTGPEGMRLMFSNCAKLKSIDLSSFDTSQVVDMMQMFYGCKSLTTLDLSNFNTAKVTDMRYMFGSCENLTTIYVGNGWTTEKVTEANSENMFNSCTKLIGGAGTGFDSSKAIDKTCAILDGGAAAPGYLTSKDVPEAPTMTLGEDGKTVTITAAEGTTIYYTLDGTDPNAQVAEQVYTEPIVLSATTTITAIAVKGAVSQATQQTFEMAASTGDVNKDGSVTIADVTALVNIILGKDNTEPYKYDHKAANVNGDDGISIADVTALVNIILGKTN